MNARRYQLGEINLAYLFKIGFSAFITFSANTVFNYISDFVLTSKVQIMATSPQVRLAKQCVYESIMTGSISSLSDCSKNGVFEVSSSSVTVSFDGEIQIEEIIEGNRVKVHLSPVFSGSDVTWQCTGSPADYMPSTCGTM